MASRTVRVLVVTGALVLVMACSGGSDRAMVVEGILPLPPGAELKVESFDTVNSRIVSCITATTQSDDSLDAGRSAFSLKLPADCAEQFGSAMRVCWIDTVEQCKDFAHKPATTLVLGELEKGYEPIRGADAP